MELKTVQAEEFERLRDLVVGILRRAPNAKAGLMGINRVVHVEVGDMPTMHRIGDALANNGGWKDLLWLPGMKQVNTWGVRTDGYGGRVQVQVEPSTAFANSVYIAINDHFDLTDGVEKPTSREDPKFSRTDDLSISEAKKQVATKILLDEWGNSMQRAEALISDVVNRGRLDS